MNTFYALDFNDIKSDIKSYIKDNSTLLKDYNYEGSAISELINVLAYVTQYQSFYLNMVANELYLSTAQLEKNIYKLSTMLGYMPKRASAPYVPVTFINASSSAINIPRYTKYTMNGVPLVSLVDVYVPPGPNSTATLTLYEGEIVQTTLSIPSKTTGGLYNTACVGPDFSVPLQQYLKFPLADDKYIDNQYINVFDTIVDENSNLSENSWIAVNEENPELNGRYYYLQYIDTLTIMFDNGSFFKSPDPGNIYVHYLKCSGTLYNNVAGDIEFNTDVDFKGKDSIVIAVDSGVILSGGTDPETVESIKNNAPLFYTTNNRAVTERDYNTVIKKYSSFDSLHDINLWGGEKEWINSEYKINSNTFTASSPYRDAGYVYYSGLKHSSYLLDRYDYVYLTDTDCTDIENFLGKYKILSVFFKPFHPNIIYFRPYSDVKLSTAFSNIIELSSEIDNYLFDTYSGLNKTLNLSNLTQYIDNLMGVKYNTTTYSTEVKVLNEGPREILSIHDVDYKDHKVIRLWDQIEQNSINAYVLISTELPGTNSVYNDSRICRTASTITTAMLLDNNSVLNSQYIDSKLYCTICLSAGATLTASQTFSIYKDSNQTVELATVSGIYRIFDVPLFATLGAICFNTTTATIGYINYQTGFATISTTGTTLSAFKTYTLPFKYHDSTSHELTRETLLSPKPIQLNVI